MRHDFERKVDVLSDSVTHEFKDTVWRDESDGSFLVKFREFDTLMEFHVINRNSFV